VFIKPRKLTLFGGFKGTMKVHSDMEIVARCPEILRQILDTQPSHYGATNFESFRIPLIIYFQIKYTTKNMFSINFIFLKANLEKCLNLRTR
jgi:hypothetical protein